MVRCRFPASDIHRNPSTMMSSYGQGSECMRSHFNSSYLRGNVVEARIELTPLPGGACPPETPSLHGRRPLIATLLSPIHDSLALGTHGCGLDLPQDSRQKKRAISRRRDRDCEPEAREDALIPPAASMSAARSTHIRSPSLAQHCDVRSNAKGVERMEKTIEVDEATTIRIKMVAIGKWLVTVNETEVPNEAKKVRTFFYDIRFVLPDGRKAMIAQRPQPGSIPTFDARVGEQELVDPGKKQSFACSECHSVVRPRDRSCPRCIASQPTAAERMQERTGRSAARGLRLSALILALILVWNVSRRGIDSAQARGDLNAVHGSTHAPSTGIGLIWSGSVVIWTIALCVTLGCSMMARRSPVDACWLHFGTWLCVFAFYSLISPQLHIGVLVFYGLFLWNMSRMVRYARAARDFTFSS
jgi:hypothetical protein